MTGIGRRIWKWLAGIFAGTAILLALLVGAFRIVVSQAPDYRQPISDWASSLLGLPVEIERLDARFGLGGPELVLAGSTIFSADRSEALVQVSEATVSLDVNALLFKWKLAADTFTLDGLTLEMERSGGGQLLLFDRPLESLPRGQGPAPISELRVRDATVIFRDRMIGGRDWVLRDFEAYLVQKAGTSRIEGRFSPPGELSDQVTFWSSHNPETWKAYVSTQRLNLAALKQIPGMPAQVPGAGTGSVRLWVDGQGAVVSRASVETEVRELVLGYGEGELAGYDLLGGRLEWDMLASGWRGRIEDLRVRRQDSQWSSSRIMVEKRAATGQQEGDFFVDADFLRLDDLAPFVALVPGDDLRESLRAMRPRGDVAGLTAQLAVVDRETRGYHVELSAEVQAVGFEPYGKLPGVAGLSGKLRTDPKGGRIELDSRDLRISFPTLFRDPLEFDAARGLVVWSRGADGLTVIGDGMTAENRDLGIDAGFRLRLPAGEETGRIDVQATASNVDLAAKSRYLPVGIMSDKVVGWLDAAIVSGRVPTARLELGGPTRGFPYPDGEGVFEVSFSTQDLVLDYAREWPRGTGIQADILFRGPGLVADIRDGRIVGTTVRNLKVEIPVLREGMLSIEGTAAGPLEAVRNYALESPLEKTIGPALTETRIENGDAEVAVDLLLPLKDLGGRDVRVDLDIQDARLLYGQVNHPLESATGRLTVKNDVVTAEGITGVFLGRPVLIDVAPYEDLGTRAYVKGEITREALVDVLNIPMENYLLGEAEWTGYVHFPRAGADGQFWIHLDSELRGMELSLPYPVAKPAEEPLPLSIDFEFPEPGLTEWTADYGARFSAQARFATADAGLDFEAAAILLGSAGARIGDERGLVVEGETDRLPALDWIGVRFTDTGEGRLENLLTRIDVTVADASFGAQHFADVSARLEQASGDWLLDLDSEGLSGRVTIPMIMATGKPVILDMVRLYLGGEDRDGEGDSTDPRKVPAMRVAAEDFRLEGLRLGRLDAEIIAVPNGFLLERYTIDGPSHSIQGQGRSLLGFGQDDSAVTLEAQTTDMGSAMEYMGFERALEAKSASFNMDLRWHGGLPESIPRVAEGTAQLDIKSGSLTEVKPGAGRVFGLLSVQALPRRLTLDFRDVFKKGFYFDELRGDFAIADGKAYTDNLVFRSPAADIGIAGYVNLTDRLYDQTAIVSADVGNTLPVVGAIAAGPAIGAGLFVLKEIFKEPLRGMINVQYRITGPWENPDVVRVAAAAGGAGTAAEPPAKDAAQTPSGGG